MRDALSLLDQVIAACGGHLDEKRVRQVLGVVPAELLADIMRAVDAADSRRVLEQVGQLAAEGYELAHFCGELTRFVRDLMIGRSCGAESTLIQVPNEQRQHIGEIAGALQRGRSFAIFQYSAASGKRNALCTGAAVPFGTGADEDGARAAPGFTRDAFERTRQRHPSWQALAIGPPRYRSPDAGRPGTPRPVRAREF